MMRLVHNKQGVRWEFIDGSVVDGELQHAVDGERAFARTCAKRLAEAMELFESGLLVINAGESHRNPPGDEVRECGIPSHKEHETGLVTQDPRVAVIFLRGDLLEHAVQRHEGLARTCRSLKVEVALALAISELLDLVRRECVQGEDRFLILLRKVRQVDLGLDGLAVDVGQLCLHQLGKRFAELVAKDAGKHRVAQLV
jgi:hypothetical protein